MSNSESQRPLSDKDAEQLGDAMLQRFFRKEATRTHIGQFRIDSLLAVGSTATVYRATDESTGQPAVFG